MDKIKYCYHTHTYRCGHAEGQDEDYVKEAIKFGLVNLGFSDHCILPYIVQPGMRGAWNLLDDYLSSIASLKRKYQDEINIYTGFEAEWMPQYESYYRDLLKNKKVDYLILGQHCYFEGNRCVWYFDLDEDEAVVKYTDHLIEGMKSGLFMYVAHPDLMMCFRHKWDNLMIKCAQRIIDAAIKYDMPLEINLCHAREYGMRELAGVLTYYEYPFTPFWQMVAKSKSKVVVGFDAHLPAHVSHPGLHIVEHILNITKIKPIYNLSIKDKKIKI